MIQFYDKIETKVFRDRIQHNSTMMNEMDDEELYSVMSGVAVAILAAAEDIEREAEEAKAAELAKILKELDGL